MALQWGCLNNCSLALMNLANEVLKRTEQFSEEFFKFQGNHFEVGRRHHLLESDLPVEFRP